MKLDTILVLDFGGQYCHLIGRKIRELGIYSEIVPYNISLKEIEALNNKFNIKGLILSGGPASVYEKNAPKIKKEILNTRLPVLGICYGHQLLAYYLTGKIKRASKKEYGTSVAIIDKPLGILKNLNKKERVWMSHGDTVFLLPKNCQILAHTANSPVAAFRVKEKPIYGIQWHPEVFHTKCGNKILNNFVIEIAKCKKNWRVRNVIEHSVNEIKKIVNAKRALIALSGGIDSSTAAALASRALGKNLTAVFVDHGFLRENETKQTQNIFKKFNIKFITISAKKRFLKRIKGIKDPEKKRIIIGNEFIRVFEEVAKKVKANYLIQGTIYPDRIESGISKKSDKIKTHHNVGGLPLKIKFKEIIEPLKDLYKDEVRLLAKKIGLPKEIVYKQPFPGPGLAIRIIGEVTPEKLKILKKADKIVTSEIEKSGLNRNLWQYFAVLTDTKSTGIKGDKRSYGYVVGVRIVKSREAMTANFAKIPYSILENISARITNEISKVVRVVYDITNKPPSTIEWE